MIRYVEDIYADFLYDCYVANQRLTEEDWLYYGREEHHIEIPACRGGDLTAFNSQHLTTYQHWVAGVLQSEVRGHLCFAYVPAGVLPPLFEMLRKKWVNRTGTSNLLNPVNKHKAHSTQKEKGMTLWCLEVKSAGGKIGGPIGGRLVSSQRWIDPLHPELGVQNAGNLVKMQKRRGLPHGPQNRVRLPK
jgi:hypothetical protein